MNETAKLIAESLAKVEDTHRAHGRAVAEHHKILAAAVVEHGSALGLDEGIVAQAAGPKIPPPNGG